MSLIFKLLSNFVVTASLVKVTCKGEINGLKATHGSATFHQDCFLQNLMCITEFSFVGWLTKNRKTKQNKSTNYNSVLNCSWYVHRNYVYESMRLRTWLFKVWLLMVSNKFCRSRQLKTNVVWLISGNRVERHFHSWSKSINSFSARHLVLINLAWTKTERTCATSLEGSFQSWSKLFSGQMSLHCICVDHATWWDFALPLILFQFAFSGLYYSWEII